MMESAVGARVKILSFLDLVKLHLVQAGALPMDLLGARTAPGNKSGFSGSVAEVAVLWFRSLVRSAVIREVQVLCFLRKIGTGPVPPFIFTIVATYCWFVLGVPIQAAFGARVFLFFSLVSR